MDERSVAAVGAPRHCAPQRLWRNRFQFSCGVARNLASRIAKVKNVGGVYIPQDLDYPALQLNVDRTRAQQAGLPVIAACSARALDKIDPPVRDVLRLGAHQLLATRVGAHAAVATSVDLAKQAAGPGPAGFVNAVLRRVATRDLAAWIDAVAPSRAADPIGHLVGGKMADAR